MNICPTEKKPVQKKSSKNIQDKNTTRKNSNMPNELQPGPSGLSKNIKTSSNPENKQESNSCLTSSEDESDKCCICAKFTPDEV